MSRKITIAEKKQVAARQLFTCNNKPKSNLLGLENYDCPLWHSNKSKAGNFDESCYEIDHITEWCLTQNDSLDNLQALCPTCHKVKTKRFLMEKNKKNKQNKNKMVKKVTKNIKTNQPDPLESFLSKMKGKQLQQLCMILNLAHSGVKSTLINKITASDHGLGEITNIINSIKHKTYFIRCLGPGTLSCAKCKISNGHISQCNDCDQFHQYHTDNDIDVAKMCEICEEKDQWTIYDNAFYEEAPKKPIKKTLKRDKVIYSESESDSDLDSDYDTDSDTKSDDRTIEELNSIEKFLNEMNMMQLQLLCMMLDMEYDNNNNNTKTTLINMIIESKYKIEEIKNIIDEIKYKKYYVRCNGPNIISCSKCTTFDGFLLQCDVCDQSHQYFTNSNILNICESCKYVCVMKIYDNVFYNVIPPIYYPITPQPTTQNIYREKMTSNDIIATLAVKAVTELWDIITK